MSKECFAPFDAGMTTLSASVFGGWAEEIIAKRYLIEVKRPSFFPFPPQIDFADITIPGTKFRRGLSNVDLFLDYIKVHNPSISREHLNLLKLEANMFKVPDIMTTDRKNNDFEWYEIKPASVSGRAKGLAKRLVLDRFFRGFSLPYVSGTSWNRSEAIPIGSGIVLGVPMEFTLEYFRDGRGLIFYHICANGDINAVLNKVSMAVFLATVAAVLIMFVGPAIVLA